MDTSPTPNPDSPPSWIKELLPWLDLPWVDDLVKLVSLLPLIALILGLLKLYSRFKAKRDYVDASLHNNLHITQPTGYIPLRFKEIQQTNLGNYANPQQSVDAEFLHEPENTAYHARQARLESHLLKRTILSLGLSHQWRNSATRQILLLGGPGTGKSFTLYRIYQKLLNPWSLLFLNKPQSLLLNLSQWNDDEDYKKPNSITRCQALQSPSARACCVLLLDGLDEYCDRKGKSPAQILEFIQKLFNYFADFRAVVIASRPFASQTPAHDTHCLHLQPLNEQEVLQSTRKRYRRKAPFLLRFNSRYKHLLERLTQDNNFLLQRICRRPLLLRYLNDFAISPYYLTQKQIQSHIKNPAALALFQDQQSIDQHFPRQICWGKKSFQKQLDALFKQLPATEQKWYFQQGGQDTLLNKAHNPTDFSSYTRIYQHILRRWHSRELQKMQMSQEQALAYQSILAQLLPSVALHLNQANSAEISYPNWEELLRSTINTIQSQENSKESPNQLLLEGLESFVVPKQDSASSPPAANPLLQRMSNSVLRPFGKNGLRFVHHSFYEYHLALYLHQGKDAQAAKLSLFSLSAKEGTWSFFTDFCRDEQKDNPKLAAQAMGESLMLNHASLTTLTCYILHKAPSASPLKLSYELPKKQRQNHRTGQTEPITQLDELTLELTQESDKSQQGFITIQYQGQNLSTTSASEQEISPPSENMASSKLSPEHQLTTLQRACFFQAVYAQDSAYIAESFSHSLQLASWKIEQQEITRSKTQNAGEKPEQTSAESKETLYKLPQKNRTLFFLCLRGSSQILIQSIKQSPKAWQEEIEEGGKEYGNLLQAAAINQDFRTLVALISQLQVQHPQTLTSWLEANYAALTALQLAIRFNSVEAMDILLNAYPKENQQYLQNWLESKLQEQWTALHFAAGYNSIKAIQLLLDVYPKQNQQGLQNWLEAKTQQQKTALHIAAQKNSAIAIQLLLNAYPKENQQGLQNWLEAETNVQGTVLHYAANLNSTKAIEILLNAYPKENQQNQQGLQNWLEAKSQGQWTALHFAASSNSADTIDLLLKAYPKENQQGLQNWLEAETNEQGTVLQYAAKRNSAEAIRLLLDAYPKNNRKARQAYRSWLKRKTSGNASLLDLALDNPNPEVNQLLTDTLEQLKQDEVSSIEDPHE